MTSKSQKTSKKNYYVLTLIVNSVAILQQNLKVLATNIFKANKDLSPKIVTEVFELKEPSYSSRSEESNFVLENYLLQ